jgi:hypothetical protein
MDVPSCFLDAGCVYYTGPNLNCSGINTNDGLDTILQKISPLLCAATGDYSSYNTYCLAPITTQQQFVETISNEFCILNGAYLSFVNGTYPTDQTALNTRITDLENPQITCASASVNDTDDIWAVLGKYCTKFEQIDNSLNPSGANWSQCYVVSPAPTTIIGGFNTLISQICILKGLVESGGSGNLPTFNNTGSCLPGPVSNADTLVDTVNKIKTRLCQTGTINAAALSFGCVSATLLGPQDLQGTLQNILTKVTQLSQLMPTVWSPDFTLTNTDNGNPCQGKTINLSATITPDRFVAATPSDLSPGTLQQKLIPGTGMQLDYITSPGFVILNSSGGSGGGDHKVAINNADTSPDYLGAKILAGPQVNGIQVSPVLDPINNVMLLSVAVDPNLLFQSLIDTLANNPTLYANFCSAVAGCPSPCAPPSNVTVTYST